MNRPRDRASAAGLLPRMEARPWADGKTITYRYHPVGSKPLNLGTDRVLAIQRVAAMLGRADATGTIGRLWAIYQDSPEWQALSERTRADYRVYAAELLPVFGQVHARDIGATDVARYLRVERRAAPVRANREISLLGNLIGVAIERGEAEHNPCRGGQVRRNKERPRTRSPEREEIDALVKLAAAKGGQWVVITMAAEFAALAGSRQAEFLRLHWPQFSATEVRLRRAKQRAGVEKVERVEVSSGLAELRTRLQAIARNPTLGAVFPNRQGNPYTSAGFAAMWGKLMREAMASGAIQQRFTFHDLRAHFVTLHKAATGQLPDLHQSATTTAKVYERSREARRRAL